MLAFGDFFMSYSYILVVPLHTFLFNLDMNLSKSAVPQILQRPCDLAMTKEIYNHREVAEVVSKFNKVTTRLPIK